MKRIKTVDTIGHLCKVTESSYLLSVKKVKKGVLEDASPADSLILNSQEGQGSKTSKLFEVPSL